MLHLSWLAKNQDRVEALSYLLEEFGFLEGFSSPSPDLQNRKHCTVVRPAVLASLTPPDKKDDDDVDGDDDDDGDGDNNSLWFHTWFPKA